MHFVNKFFNMQTVIISNKIHTFQKHYKKIISFSIKISILNNKNQKAITDTNDKLDHNCLKNNFQINILSLLITCFLLLI